MYKVMLVDDDINILNGLKKCIDWEQYGFTVAYCEYDPVLAIEKLISDNVELIITDINMAQISGLELIKRVRGVYNPKVIILSGYNEFSYAKEAIELGVFHYLLKPVDIDELIKSLDTVKKELDKNNLNFWNLIYDLTDFSNAMDNLDTAKMQQEAQKIREVLINNSYTIEEIRAFLFSLKSRINHFISEDMCIDTVDNNNLSSQIFTSNDALEWLDNTCKNAVEYVKSEYKDIKSPIIQEIVEYVNANYSTDITMEAIAAKYFFNAKYLGRVFKANMNMSFNEYFNRLRIEKIISKIKNGEKVHKAILDSGYKTPSAFYKAFQKYEGVSFVEYKRANLLNK